MVENPTCEELEQTIKDLKTKLADAVQEAKVLEVHRKELLSVFDSIDEAIYVCDPENYKLLYVNEATRAIFGDDIVGRRCYRVFQGSDRPCEFCTNPKIFGESLGNTYVWEFQNKVNRRWYRCIDKAIKWPDGRIVRYEMAVDIDDLRRSQEALGESEQRYRDLYEKAPNAYFSVNPADGSILRCNAAAEKLLGYDKTTLMSMKVIDLYADTPEGKPNAKRVFEDFKSGRSVRDVHLQMRHKEGHPVWVSLTVEPGIDSAGNIIESRSMAIDISARKHAEDALRKRSEEIKRFAYSVSHDLRGPAIGVYGLTRLLSKKYGAILGDRGRSYCDQILDAAEQISLLVSNINMYISAKEIPLCIETFELKEILQGVREEFSPELDNRQIRWQEPETESEIQADRLSTLRILRNLVDNALKYGGERLSKIRIGYNRTDNFHVISVSDDGDGINDIDARKIFRAFQRSKKSKGIQGSGLGLSIVRELAERHGGEAWMESRRENGATFYVSISRQLSNMKGSKLPPVE